ncbi:MAG TPA: putative baseplate assembly protein [Gammaproteobacteria bacterium]
MPLTDPVLDSRTYREILDEALARIPAHNPEWTNFNDSDPGITLLQLFSFMTESVIYRANLIPERNRRKFLKLLNIGMLGADAARGIVTFSNPKGSTEAMTVAADQELYAGDVPFRTITGLDVLPVEHRLYYKSPVAENRKAEVKALYDQLYASYNLPGTALEFYETKQFVMPESGAVLPTLDIAGETVDGSLWIAILRRSVDTVEQAREAIQGKTLSLGIVPALSADGSVLYPLRVSAINDNPSLVFEIPNTETNIPRYARLTPRNDHDVLAEPGVVELTLPSFAPGNDAEGRKKLGYWDALDPLESGVGDFPPSLEDTNDQDRLVTWIRIRSPETATAASEESGVLTGTNSRQIKSPVSWVGINAAKVQQRAHVQSEQLGLGTGEPDQVARLSNTPVLPDSVRIRVNGELWERIDDLAAAGPEVSVNAPRFSVASAQKTANVFPGKVKVFTVDRESGEVRFGDGFRGMRPPRGANIQATYDYGGGKKGSVGIGSINKHTSLNTALKVTNPVPTWGGRESESVTQAEARIPSVIRHRDRLVTKQDYQEIVQAAPGISLGRLDVLPTVHPQQPLQDSHGVVTLMVIPASDPAHPEAPSPDNVFLRTLCAYLEPRRIITTELHIVGPVYRDLWVSLSVEIIPGFDTAPVLEAVRTEVKRFLSPLQGGFDGKGWPLNKAVEAGEISGHATRVSGVAKVNRIHIGDSSGTLATDFSVTGLELPRLAGLSVGSGVAPTIEEMQSGTSGEGDAAGGVQIIPVPVIPPEC